MTCGAPGVRETAPTGRQLRGGFEYEHRRTLLLSTDKKTALRSLREMVGDSGMRLLFTFQLAVPDLTTAPFGTTMIPSRMHQPSPSAFVTF